MSNKINENICNLKNVFLAKGLNVDETQNGIKFIFEETQDEIIVEFYALKNNPEYVRARISNAQADSLLLESELFTICKKLQDYVKDIAVIEQFSFFGIRNGLNYYYASVDMKVCLGYEKSAKDSAHEIIDQLKEVDSKVFRQELDKLKLSRSSILRIALSRIFRGAVDAEELLNTINEEAEKFIESDEKQILEDIKKKSSVLFMKKIVDLLYSCVFR